jgi:hypothetical protein
MDTPVSLETQTVHPDIMMLRACTPVPGLGILPVNAFLIRAAEPVLVDTGLGALRTSFLDRLRAAIEPRELRWIWLTHTDADHVGNLEAVLAEAPLARVVTSYLGMGKLGLLGLPVERCYLLNPGQCLDVGDRQLFAVRPPCFDAPETTGLYDSRSGSLFSADCFGAVLDRPSDNAAEVPAADLESGMVTWTGVDAPWLHLVDPQLFEQAMNTVASIEPRAVFSSHLPPAEGMLDTLLAHLRKARTAPAFIGPDQAALERMMASPAAACPPDLQRHCGPDTIRLA